MTIEVERADEAALEGWDDYVDRSPMSTLFHRLPVLRMLEAQSNSTLHPLIGYKGQEVVGLLPLFELSKGPMTAVFSPPPRLLIPNLGPALLNHQKLKRQKRDRLNRQFIEGSIDWIDSELGPGFVNIKTPVGYSDVRPFQWADFDVNPQYTYEVDLSVGEETVMKRFKKSLRSDIRRSEDEAFEITVGETDAIEFIIEQVNDRYEAQGKSYPVGPSYGKAMGEALPDDQFTPYIAKVDGTAVSGILVPRSDDRIYFWQGGVKPDTSLPVNDHLHWRAIRDAIEDDVDRYDLVGANTKRLAKYKAQFNPDLTQYYEVERGNRVMNVASKVYRRLR